MNLDEQLPIGRPYNNYRVFLLNEDLTETQNGEIGEICVSGPILALVTTMIQSVQKRVLLLILTIKVIRNGCTEQGL